MDALIPNDYNDPMTIKEYSSLLEDVLRINDFDDISLNGIQIDTENRELNRVAFSVDASLDSIEKAVSSRSDILVVHHGLFWGRPVAIRGDHYKRVKSAIKGDLMLFAAHLPLDAHPVYGNNAQIANIIGLENREDFGYWKGKAIGLKGILNKPKTMDEISSLLGFDRNVERRINSQENKKYSSVAIVSGSGSSDISDAIKEGVELFITGEIKHEVYWTAQEAGLSVLAGGHYKTETFGVKALQKMTEEMGIETVFIEGETGL